MPGFEKIETTPDRDGDSVNIVPMHEYYRIEVRSADGDFQSAYVACDDMLRIARAVIAYEDGA